MAGNSNGFGRINNELDRMAGISRRRRLRAQELQRLDELVEETRAIASKDNSKMFHRLHQRAKLIRKSWIPASKPAPQHRKVCAPSCPPASSAAPP